MESDGETQRERTLEVICLSCPFFVIVIVVSKRKQGIAAMHQILFFSSEVLKETFNKQFNADKITEAHARTL